MQKSQEFDEQTIKKLINKYNWYHQIYLTDTIKTPGPIQVINTLNEWVSKRISENIDFRVEKVLDIGCRDGLFSFQAEKGGAKEVIGIDNDLSLAATEFLIPYFKSNVKMFELNIYDLVPEKFGLFNIILLLGVLYHLKFPFLGLKKISDCIEDKGILVISTAILNEPKLEELEFLYCPGDESGPFGYSCPTFFNKKGLCTTMHTYKMKFLKSIPFTNDVLGMQLLFFQKDNSIEPVKVKNMMLDDYYFSTHKMYSELTPSDLQDIYNEQSNGIINHWNKLMNWKRKL